MNDFSKKVESAALAAAAKLQAPCVWMHEPDIAAITLRVAIFHRDDDKHVGYPVSLAEAANMPERFPLLFRKTYPYAWAIEATAEQIAEDFETHVRSAVDSSLAILNDWKSYT